MPRLHDTPDEAALRARLRTWLSANVPAEKRLDWPGRIAWQRTLHQAGWLGLTWPSEYGGQGATLREQFVYNEELARAQAPDLPNGIGLLFVGPALIAVGSAEQKRRYLPKILSADEIWCQGFSEPNAGSDLANLQTRAISDRDGYVVTGQKIWSSNSRHANLCFLLARTDGEAQRHKGISCLIVDLKAPGVEVKPLRQITGDAEFGEIFLDGVRVPKANLVGAENEGWMVAMKTFTRERANIAMSLSVRLNQQLEEMLRQVRKTGADAELRRRVAQAYVDSQSLDWSCRRFGEELYGFHSALIKVAWAETNQALQELGLGLRGADVPVLEEEPAWQFGYLRSRGASIEGGTSEILRTIIAERILGLPRLGKG
jgi:alkylation response protein AidB-like acyl-CoA dehydrogenase